MFVAGSAFNVGSGRLEETRHGLHAEPKDHERERYRPDGPAKYVPMWHSNLIIRIPSITTGTSRESVKWPPSSHLPQIFLLYDSNEEVPLGTIGNSPSHICNFRRSPTICPHSKWSREGAQRCEQIKCTRVFGPSICKPPVGNLRFAPPQEFDCHDQRVVYDAAAWVVNTCIPTF